MADELGVRERTVRRWLARPEDADTKRTRHVDRFEVTEKDVSDLAYWNGSIQALVRARRAAGMDVPSRQTLERAFHRALTPGSLQDWRAASVPGASSIPTSRIRATERLALVPQPERFTATLLNAREEYLNRISTSGGHGRHAVIKDE